jgi:hypothetical protein
MKKTVSPILVTAVFCTVLFAFAGCGKYSRTVKILEKDATEGSMNWRNLIREYGINYKWGDSTLLGQAIKANRIDLVQTLIKDGADVNREVYGNMNAIQYYTLLLTALYFGSDINTQIPVLLIKQGASSRDVGLFFAKLFNESKEKNSNEACLQIFKEVIKICTKEQLDWSNDLSICVIYDDSFSEDYTRGWSYSSDTLPIRQIILEGLMEKGVKFSYYDIANAIEAYASSDTYPESLDIIKRVIEHDVKTYEGIYVTQNASGEEEGLFDIAVRSLNLRYLDGTNPERFLEILDLLKDNGAVYLSGDRPFEKGYSFEEGDYTRYIYQLPIVLESSWGQENCNRFAEILLEMGEYE